MEPTSTASIKAARWLIAALLAVNLYRAMTQSVTPGEAWNYDRFIGPSGTEALASFDGILVTEEAGGRVSNPSGTRMLAAHVGN